MAKRLYDVFWAGLGLLLLWPVFLGIALAIKLSDGGPVFFRQTRIGIKGVPFCIFKFRTMASGAESKGPSITIGSDQRITRVGGMLRAYKLDELPQLINVLLGDMSLVGPRPEVPRYVDLYTPEQRLVLDYRPGITDPASLKFRQENEILGNVEDPERHYREVIMPDKISINLAYAQQANLFTDTWIILKTVLGL